MQTGDDQSEHAVACAALPSAYTDGHICRKPRDPVMVSAVGISAHDPSALEGRIRQDQIQLNDWTTCVSAKTPKGQAAIQKLSGEISADKEQIARALQAQSGVPSAASAASSADAQSAKSASLRAASAPGRPSAVDVWA